MAEHRQKDGLNGHPSSGSTAEPVAAPYPNSSTSTDPSRQLKVPNEPPPPPTFGLPSTTAFGSLSPPSRSFPDSPSTELPPIQPRDRSASSSTHSLPSLASLTGGQPLPPVSQQHQQQQASSYSIPPPRPASHWPSLNPLTAYYTPSHALPPEPPKRQESRTEFVFRGRSERRSTSVSLEDPDVRMAAEALGDLRADFLSSPPNRSTALPSATPSPRNSSTSERAMAEQPTLSFVLDTAASAYQTGVSAYQTTAQNYPAVKASVDYVGGYVAPIASSVATTANSINTVSKRMGVHNSMRWILGRRFARKLNAATKGENGGDSKRRRINSGESRPLSDKELAELIQEYQAEGRRDSTSTVDTLPLYVDDKSPDYSEMLDGRGSKRSSASSSSTILSRTLKVTTSALGAAAHPIVLERLIGGMSSLQELILLIKNKTNNLKELLDQCDGEDVQMSGSPTSDPSKSGNVLFQKLNQGRIELGEAVRAACNIAKSYTEYVPENVRELIHVNINTIPGLFPTTHSTSNREDPVSQAREGASKMVLFANRSLDRFVAVCDVLGTTIQAAEDWLGKVRAEGKETAPASSVPGVNHAVARDADSDVAMT